MIWPQKTQWISIPSAVFTTLFFWNAFLYLIFTLRLPNHHPFRRQYFFFGLISLSLASYSFFTFFLYSSDSISQSLIWQRAQFISSIPIFIFFVLFSSQYLKIKSSYWKYWVPAISCIFFPFFIFSKNLFLDSYNYKVFELFQYSATVIEADFGYWPIIFFFWIFPHLFFLAYRWIRHPHHYRETYSLSIAFILLLLATINDSLVGLGIYQFFYLMELGFVIMVGVMALRMLQEYVLTSQKIIKKTQQVHQLNREMHYLLDMISHDFMAPLISIEGFIDLLIRRKQDKESKHQLERIDFNVNHLKTLIGDLSDFIKFGRSKETIHSVDLKKVFGESLDILNFNKLDTPTEIQTPKSWPAFQGSEKSMKQIFLNLLQNIQMHGIIPGQNLSVKLEILKKPHFLEFSLEDNGPGIDQKFHQDVFKSYFQIDTQKNGSGLGLALVKRIIDRCGGKIWFDSTHTKGTKICFLIPQS